MCGQKPEKIIYKSRNYDLATLPLGPYLESLKDNNIFQGPSTALHRGYLGTWKIKNKLLLLVELKGYLINYSEVDIQYLFPGEDVVFANWYTGTLRLPLGCRIFDNIDTFYSIYEAELRIKIENGYVIETEKVDTLDEALQRRRQQEEKDEIPF